MLVSGDCAFPGMFVLFISLLCFNWCLCAFSLAYAEQTILVTVSVTVLISKLQRDPRDLWRLGQWQYGRDAIWMKIYEWTPADQKHDPLICINQMHIVRGWFNIKFMIIPKKTFPSLVWKLLSWLINCGRYCWYVRTRWLCEAFAASPQWDV